MEKNQRKMRIQTLDEHGAVINDRLVSQMPEFYAGPKEVCPNGVIIEFQLGDSDDIERAQLYLKQLSGKVPLNIVKRGRKSTIAQEEEKSAEMSDSQRQEVITQLIGKGTQDKAIKFLRELDFRFVSSDFLEQLELKIGDSDETPIGVSKLQYDSYSWALRTIKLAKDPANDKYDPTVAVGFKLFGKSSERVKVYLYSSFYKTIKLDVPDKPKYVIKKVSAVKYPDFMTYDERSKWRKHHRDVENGKPATKFYERWTPHIDLGDGAKQ